MPPDSDTQTRMSVEYVECTSMYDILLSDLMYGTQAMANTKFVPNRIQ